MNLGEMLRTFHDAMIVTKLLGFRYIWIDSLCIIQDSGEDWERESAKMSTIYANSSLTIAAYSSDGDKSGFLGDRDIHNLWLECWLGSDLVGHIRIREEIAHDDSEMITSNPLLTRAWAFQELLLSPRLLCFTAHEIQWHCRESSLCECDNWRGMSLSLGVSTLRRRRTNIANIQKYPISQWYMLVEAYSRLKLTRPSDRLPAISALAERFQQGLESHYHAGIWTKHTERSLKWAVSWEYPSIGTFPKDYSGPSRSWASVEGTIFHDMLTNQKKTYEYKIYSLQEATLIDTVEQYTDFYKFRISSGLSGIDPFGKVKLGSMIESNFPLVTAMLEIPEVPEGTDEGSVIYNIWQQSKTRISHARWPPVMSEYFRPDVPLVQASFKDHDSISSHCRTVRRSMLKPTQYRSKVEGHVYIYRPYHCGIVLGCVEMRNGMRIYERIGLLVAPPSFNSPQFDIIGGSDSPIGDYQII